MNSVSPLPTRRAGASACLLWLLFSSIQPLHAGMTSYGLDSMAGFRLQALSFFLVLLLVLSWGLKRLWNGREPFLYLGKGRSASDPGEQAFLVSPFLSNNRVAYLRMNGSSRYVRIFDDKRGEEQFQDLLSNGLWPDDVEGEEK